jgi:hypothetical protein
MTSKFDSGGVTDPEKSTYTTMPEEVKGPGVEKHLEHVDSSNEDLVYDDAEHEPELHFRTWIALVSMFLYNYVIIITLLSPAAVVSRQPSYSKFDTGEPADS